MNAFGYQITQHADGFTVSATTDDVQPVTVTLREWEWQVPLPWGGSENIGLIRTRHLVDRIADLMRRDLFTNSRPVNVRVKYGTIPRTARVIHRMVLGEVKRLFDLVPDEVIATQRAVFAATYGTANAGWPELYRPEYAMLRRDIRQYRAAAAALVNAPQLARLSAEAEVAASPEFAALKAAAERAGLCVNLTPAPLIPAPHAAREPRTAILDRLARDWRGLFSPTGHPYTSLNRTLMNLPGGIPAGMLRYLGDIDLPRPVTDRVELLALLASCACRRESAPKHLHLFTHAERRHVARAVELVATATQTPASPRRAADIARTVGYLCDFPDAHRGNVVGLARKSVRWHRDAMEREAAAILERLGDRPTASPPIPLPCAAGVEFLDSTARVAAEGTVMGHCAATYAEPAVDGHCYLFHIDHDGETATVEVSQEGRVVQAQGPRNQGNGAARWGRRVLAQWGRGFPACEPTRALLPGDDPWGLETDGTPGHEPPF